MRSKNVFAWLAAFTSVAVVACSSVSPTQACTDLSAAICDKASQCAPGAFNEVYGDTTTCTTRATASCEQALALKDTADTPDFAEKCSQSYTTVSCGDAADNNPPAACKRTTFGKIADGAACGTAGECASGVCQIDGTTGCGKCIEPVASGQACQSNGDCQTGLVCAAASQSSAVCIAPVGAGATCSTAVPIIPCQEGLICDGAKCQTPLAAGSACNPTKSLCDGVGGYWCTPKGTRCVAVKYAGPNQTCGYDATSGDLTVCTGSGAGAGLLGACMNINQQTGQGTCAAAAPDGAACDLTNGPFCTPPALCLNKTCTIVDPSTCH